MYGSVFTLAATLFGGYSDVAACVQPTGFACRFLPVGVVRTCPYVRRYCGLRLALILIRSLVGVRLFWRRFVCAFLAHVFCLVVFRVGGGGWRCNP